jgi:hypothetical protein
MNSKTSRKSIRNEARPLGTKRPKPEKRSKLRTVLAKVLGEPADTGQVPVTAEKKDQKVLALDSSPTIDSVMTVPAITPDTIQGAPQTMAMATLTLTGLSKSKKYALYKGLRTVARLSVTDFPDSKPPQTLEVSGDLAGPRVIKEKRAKLTPEELKARREARKNGPKPTLAEQIAKREQKLAREQERIAELKAKAEQGELAPAF